MKFKKNVFMAHKAIPSISVCLYYIFACVAYFVYIVKNVASINGVGVVRSRMHDQATNQ